MIIKDLQGKGLITRIEILYIEMDGSTVVFIEGKSCVPPSAKNVKPFQVMMSKPPEFLDLDKMKVELIGKEKEIKKFLNYIATLKNLPFRLLGFVEHVRKAERKIVAQVIAR
jgi:hypothetical protein